MVIVGIFLLFLIASKLFLARALFRTRALQWARHRKTTIKPEALWVWRITLLLVLVVGAGEFLKSGNAFTSSSFKWPVLLGFLLFVLGLWAWVGAMDARKQYFWYFQVLAPREELPAYSTNGIYGLVRNPRELGFLLVLAGLAILLGLKFATVFVIILLFATMYRVNSRDRIMIEKYGKQYIDYSRSSKKLIPFVW
jgi:protein-S-isoprenylcysteine O-methyltransferase Ste14